MSDLDDELRGLRDELNRAIPLPDVGHVTGRARARRRLQLGAIAAVVVVALVVPVLRALPADLAPAAPPDSSRTTFTLDFADPDHGYALARSCSRDCSFTRIERTTAAAAGNRDGCRPRRTRRRTTSTAPCTCSGPTTS